MYVRNDIRNWGGFCKIKNILSSSSCTVKEMWLLTESSEFSQSIQTPPLLVIPRKQIRTTVCCSSPGLTTKSLLKNKKEKASLGNRFFCGYFDWNAGGEHRGEHAGHESSRPLPRTGENRTLSPGAPAAEPFQGLSAVFKQDGSRPKALHVKTHTLNFTGAKAACQEN